MLLHMRSTTASFLRGLQAYRNQVIDRPNLDFDPRQHWPRPILASFRLHSSTVAAQKHQQAGAFRIVGRLRHPAVVPGADRSAPVARLQL
jgi:hypothetical protein